MSACITGTLSRTSRATLVESNKGMLVPKGVDHALPSTDESDVLRFRDLDGITAEVSAV